MLLTGERFGMAEIMRWTGLSTHAVWSWQERYVEAGVDGPLRDKTRPSRVPKLADEKVAEQAREDARAMVLSIDEKSQIRGLDRTQPGLPMKRGRLATMTHDDKRNGTTTLFPALSVLDETVIDQNRQRHRQQESTQFLNAVERQILAGKSIHVMLAKSMVRRPPIPLCKADVGSKPATGAAHKHAEVKPSLAHHPR